MCLLEDLTKTHFAKRSYKMINPFTIHSMRKIGRCTDISYKPNIRAIDKVFSDGKGFFYFKLLRQGLYNNIII